MGDGTDDAHADLGYGAQTEAETLAQMERRVVGEVDAQGYPRVGLLSTLSPVVTTWPCWACKVPVEVTDAAVHALECNNRILVKMGERPIRTDNVVFCDACGARWRRKRTEARDRADKLIQESLARLRAQSYERTQQGALEEREDEQRVERMLGGEGRAILIAIRERKSTKRREGV